MTKYFIGGLQIRCNEFDVKEAFSKSGTLKEVIIMRDKITGISRGFGFIQFEDRVDLIPAGQVRVFGYHVLGRGVELKLAVPLEVTLVQSNTNIKN